MINEVLKESHESMLLESPETEKEVLTEIIAHLGLPDGALERLLKWTVEGYNWLQSGYAILNDLAE